jgi:hypothetical protein
MEPTHMLGRTLAALLLASLTLTAHAEGTAIALHGSAQGGGVELTTRLTENYNARLAYHQYTYQGTDLFALLRQLSQVTTDMFGMTKSDIFYDHHGKQKIWSAKADWYPDPESQFRFSFGLSHNNDQDDIIGRELILGGYNIGNNHYSASQVGKLQGTIRSNCFAPYVGYGWGNPVLKNKKWGWILDAGMMYQGKPDITLSATGSVSPADLAAEQTRLVNDSLTWTPLFSVAVSYQW